MKRRKERERKEFMRMGVYNYTGIRSEGGWEGRKMRRKGKEGNECQNWEERALRRLVSQLDSRKERV